MYPFLINIVVAGLILFMTYALTSEGLWGAALMCFNVMFAGLIAFNFYEPLAAILASNASVIAGHADTICMMSIFLVSLWILRLTTETLAPALIRYPSILYQLGRLFFGFAGSVMTVAIILLAFEAAPVHKNVFGFMDYRFKPPFKMGVDQEWLAFFQWTTGAIFPTYSGNARDQDYANAKVFDPRGEWLLNHQNARPAGTETVLSTVEGGGAAPAAGEGGAGGAPPGGADAGKRPGDFTVPGSGATGVVVPN